MRTTISLDDDLGEAARRRAREEGLSLSAFVARALRGSLSERRARASAPRFRLVTAGGGGPRPGLDLDRTSELEALADEAAYGTTKRTSRR
ncbi:MAG TPA: hypothetical protein VKF32_03475 [Thermoanaerobaculia bacterium]|nr:hypothetical protein [Thermoanaerobaculia bacterium]